MRKRFGRSAMWGIIAEDLPEEDNQVVLDLSLTDADGIPAPRIRYRMSENSVRLLDFHVTRATESLREAGAYETLVAPQIRETGWHLLGTCMMGMTGDLGRGPLGPHPRRPQPLHLRRQPVADLVGDEPDRDHRRARPAQRRAPHRQPPRPGGARVTTPSTPPRRARQRRHRGHARQRDPGERGGGKRGARPARRRAAPPSPAWPTC